MPGLVKRLLVAGSVIAVATSAIVAVAAGESPASERLLPLGCANPGNHFSNRLLPPTVGSASGQVTCFGEAELTSTAAGPVGLRPSDIQSAYGLTRALSGGGTVALVDAYDDPNAESDLAAYRQTFRLPSCTTANGCFVKVNQSGSTAPLPDTDYGWAEEISLGLDAVSATCPRCHILLVEASSVTDTDLLPAIDTAARLGADAVVMAWGGAENATIRQSDRHLNHPAVNLVAASGDDGYGVQWPASSPSVTAVGGTTLIRAKGTTRGWQETAWSGAGSGCSRYEPKPVWQTDPGCPRRSVADVAAVANPTTGLAVYDTLNNCLPLVPCNTQLVDGTAQGLDGWARLGGTSLSTPVIASIYALTAVRRGARAAYTFPQYLNDVVSGSNGSCPGARMYLCTAGTGYDGPTGMGTPRGVTDF